LSDAKGRLAVLPALVVVVRASGEHLAYEREGGSLEGDTGISGSGLA
jgi:hypothetical protein